MSHKISRRKFVMTALGTAAVIAGMDVVAKIASQYGLLAPDYGGILGVGEALTYGAQRILMSGHSLAREFSRSEISKVSPVNHGHPHYDPYERLLAGKFADWRLYVDGLVARPTAFSLADLKRLPSRTQITELRGRLVLHCCMDWRATFFDTESCRRKSESKVGRLLPV